MMTNKPLILMGMMGVGKSSLSKILATSLSLERIDIDEKIVEAEQKTIPELFAQSGEPYFRTIESHMIETALTHHNSIISIGGGAIMTPSTASLIWAKAVSIWIHSDVDVLLERLCDDLDRPLLHNDDPLGTLKALEKERLPVYKKANIHIHSGHESLEETADKIIKELDAQSDDILKET